VIITWSTPAISTVNYNTECANSMLLIPTRWSQAATEYLIYLIVIHSVQYIKGCDRRSTTTTNWFVYIA